jgi:hypothetical protein
MLREVLLDLVCLHLGETLDFRRKYRSTIENAIGGLNQVGRKNYDPDSDDYNETTPADLNEFGRKIYYHWDEAEEIKKIWDVLQKMRNTFAHAAHQAQPVKLEDSENTINNVFERVKALGVLWNILESDVEGTPV